MFYKKGVLKNFAKFIGKHLSWKKKFIINIQACSIQLATLLIKRLCHSCFFGNFCEICTKTCYIEHIWKTASEITNFLLILFSTGSLRNWIKQKVYLHIVRNKFFNINRSNRGEIIYRMVFSFRKTLCGRHENTPQFWMKYTLKVLIFAHQENIYFARSNFRYSQFLFILRVLILA